MKNATDEGRMRFPLQRRLAGLALAGAPSAVLQKPSTCFVPAAVALFVAFAASRLTAAVAWLRAAPAALLALLSHRLMNGFFVVQGFFIVAFKWRMPAKANDGFFSSSAEPAARCFGCRPKPLQVEATICKARPAPMTGSPLAPGLHGGQGVLSSTSMAV